MHVPGLGVFLCYRAVAGGGTPERVTFSFILPLSFYEVSFF